MMVFCGLHLALCAFNMKVQILSGAANLPHIMLCQIPSVNQAYASLMFGNQMVCGWTWQSMWGGEEQYLEGMVDWDGIPNRKYDEYKKIATEFKKIEKYFPYKPQAEVGLAFSFPSQIASYSFPEQHEGQVGTCFKQFFNRNMDVRMLDIIHSDLKYKLLIIPGCYSYGSNNSTKNS